MKPITRKEYYLAKAAGTYTGPTPPPVLREDYYLATLSGDYSGNCPAPVTRLDMFMSAAAGLTSYVPQPVTRIEKYWYAIAKGTGYVPEPVTREEKFLYAILKNPPKPEYLDKTAEGSMILLDDSAEAPLTALTVYGHSTQSGTPSPENPVPIVSAGDSGEIEVTVSDGGTQSQTLTLSTPGGLPGIPVLSGGNYTDENGQQRIADVKDYGTGKYTQNVQKIKIDATKLMKSSSISNDMYYVSYYNNICLPILGANDRADGILCNYLKPYKNIYYESVEGMDITNITEYSMDIRFGFGLGNMPTLEEAKQWFSENDVFVYYPLATPIVTDISAEEIASYKALHTYSPATTVSNDAGAWMKVGYKATP